VPIDLEIESSILYIQISLMGNECGFKFFNLEPTIESKLTLEPELDFFELVLVHEPFIVSPSQPFH